MRCEHCGGDLVLVPIHDAEAEETHYQCDGCGRHVATENLRHFIDGP